MKTNTTNTTRHTENKGLRWAKGGKNSILRAIRHTLPPPRHWAAGAAFLAASFLAVCTRSATGRSDGGLAYNNDRWITFLTGSQYGNTENRINSSRIVLYRLGKI